MGKKVKLPDLKGYTGIVLEKRGVLVVSKNFKISAYSLQDRNCVWSSEYIEYPSGFCTNPEETVLYCFTTTSRLYTFDTDSWECTNEQQIAPPYDLCGNRSFFELAKVFYMNERFLLAAGLGLNEVMLIEVDSGHTDLIWEFDPCQYDAVTDVTYRTGKNRLTIILVKIEVRGGEAKLLDHTCFQLKSDRFKLVVGINEIVVGRRPLFIDREATFMISLKRSSSLLGEGKIILNYSDLAKQQFDSSTQVNESCFGGQLMGTWYMREQMRIALLYDRGLLILKIEAKEINLEKVIPMQRMSDLCVWQMTLFAIGWEYGAVIGPEQLCGPESEKVGTEKQKDRVVDVEKKHTRKLTGRLGIVSNRQNLFVIAEKNCLVKYDMRTEAPLKVLDMEGTEGLDLDANEDLLYGFTASRVYLVEMKSFELAGILNVHLPDQYGEWEIKGCYHIKDRVVLLIISMIDSDYLVILQDMDSEHAEIVHREDMANQIRFDKQAGLQIITDEWYRPKCNRNRISCKREWLYSKRFSIRIAATVMQSDTMTVKKQGTLYFVDPKERFSLVMESRLLNVRYLFVDHASMTIIKEIASPFNYFPTEAYFVPEGECLALVYEKKTIIFSTKNLAFDLKAIVRTSVAASRPLYFRDTGQLLVLDGQKGNWLDLNAL